MALTSEEQRRCYLYCGYIQVNRTGVFVGGQPQTTELVQLIQTSLDNVTPNGETTVRDLLALIDPLFGKLATVDTRFQAAQVGTITLNPKEWEQRLGQHDYFRRLLARTLDIPLDPFNEADAGGGACGPTREP